MVKSILLLTALLFAGCTVAGEACVSDKGRACTCSDGQAGVRTCLASGFYSDCVCDVDNMSEDTTGATSTGVTGITGTTALAGITGITATTGLIDASGPTGGTGTAAALAITSFSPADGATGVSRTPTITVVFSRAVLVVSVAATLNGVPQAITTSSNDSMTFTFVPNTLAYQTAYTFEIAAETSDGVALTGVVAMTFTTVLDQSTPAIFSTSPTQGQGAVSENATITFTFTKPMNKASVEAAFSISNGTCTFTWPDAYRIRCSHATWPYSTAITVTLAAGAVDQLGLALAPAVRTFTVRPDPKPTLAGMVIVTYPGQVHLRQGAGNVVINVSGSNLASITSASVSNGAVTFTTAITGTPSATNADLTVTIPHGAPLIAFDISVTSSYGTATLASAFTVTNIYSSPAGNDAYAGTSAQPFRSLKRALQVAGGGDKIMLLDGTYNETSGEVWAGGWAPPQNVPSGITIEGQGVNTIVSSTSNGSGVHGLSIVGDVTLRKFSVRGFYFGIVAWSSAVVNMHAMDLRSNGTAALATANSAVVKLYGADIHDNGTGVWVTMTSTLQTYTDSEAPFAVTSIHHNATGIRSIQNSTVTAFQAVVRENGLNSPAGDRAGFLAENESTVTIGSQASVQIWGNSAVGVGFYSNGLLAIAADVYDNGKAPGCTSDTCGGLLVGGGFGTALSVSVNYAKIHDNGGSGIYWAQSESRQFSLSNSELYNNAVYALRAVVYAPLTTPRSSLTVRSTSIHDHPSYPFFFLAGSYMTYDFGSASVPGNNVISAGSYPRGSAAGGSNYFWFRATSFNGVTPPSSNCIGDGISQCPGGIAAPTGVTINYY
ncbi:MAG: Ig-like domain-containing protein [Deltaproteobacteria bacterium]|nr:Ig-like domain-containing protein [Deltaproteobacteria bacterium]